MLPWWLRDFWAVLEDYWLLEVSKGYITIRVYHCNKTFPFVFFPSLTCRHCPLVQRLFVPLTRFERLCSEEGWALFGGGLGSGRQRSALISQVLFTHVQVVLLRKLQNSEKGTQQKELIRAGAIIRYQYRYSTGLSVQVKLKQKN